MNDDDEGGRVVYLVAAVNYDTCMHLAGFTEPEDAAAYAADYNRARPVDPAKVLPLVLDQPRETLPGAYEVEVDAEGTVVSEGWITYTSPAAPRWGDGVRGAHWWRDGDERTTTAIGAVIRAVGIDRTEALARADRLLASPLPTAKTETQKAPE